MKIILIILLNINLFAITNNKETCHTVQLISLESTKENKQQLFANNYPKECKLMKIGTKVTVRCGCFNTKERGTELLSKLSKVYKNTFLTKTYKYRFKELPLPLKIKNKDRKKQLLEKKIKIAKVLEEELILDPVVLNKVEKKSKKVKKSQKVKKSKKVKYSLIKQKKYTNSYNKYLDKLESRRSIGKFQYRYRFGAQISYDIGYINEADITYRDSNFRRLRIFHKGSFFHEKLFYELEYSFIGDSYKDMYIGYKNRINVLGVKYRTKLGNIKIPFSLETYTSSKYITFMERALTDSFAEGRKVGAELLLSKKIEQNRINVFAALFSNSINERIENKINQPGYALRVTYGYQFRKNHLFSLGVAQFTQDMKGENVKYNQASESNFAREKFISVKVKDVDVVQKNNLEFLYIYDKLFFQSEYTIVSMDSLKDKYSFSGYYLEGSYFLLGNGRKYKFNNATLSKVKPGKDGSVELAFRYSYLNLNDNGVNGTNPEMGGSQTDYNYGVNWYVNNELKFMVNYIVAQPTQTDEYDGMLQILQARVLFAF